ncbi:MAG: hypothetical protein LDLANPLL_01986 [Turneriella sp.]|nr:hypothetical protein [Turneriella sp.]
MKLNSPPNSKTAKPFLKWAGGKTQPITDIDRSLPKFVHSDDFIYIEPFVGSGAILFWMLGRFPNLKRAVINDINEDLINAYKIIATKPLELISLLESIQNEYHTLEKDIFKKKEYYYNKRGTYNTRESTPFGRVFRSNLFVRSSQKGFPLQPLTQSAA